MRVEKTKEICIDDVQYRSTIYMTTKGLDIAERVLLTFGEPVAVAAEKFLSADGELALDMVLPEGALTETVKALCANLHADGKTVQLLKDIVSTTLRCDENGNYRPIVFDTDFAGDLWHLMKLICALISYQIVPFYKGFADFKNLVAAAKPKEPRSTIKAK